MPTEIAPDLEAILDDLHAAVHADAAPAPSRRRAPVRRRLLLAAPVAAAMAAALVVGLGVGNEPPASAARQLQHAAALVAGDPAPVIRPGQYWYVKGIGTFANEVGADDGSRFSALQTSSHEIWIASDRSGRILRTDGPPAFFSEAERARWEAAGKPPFGDDRAIDEAESAGELSWGTDSLGVNAPAQIPSSPFALAALLERRTDGTKNTRAWDEFKLIGDVLRFAPLSGAQTAAFYQVMAGIPGVEVTVGVKDGIGRTGTAFSLEHDGATREEIILDPDTGRMLGSRTTLVKADPLMRDVPAGTVLGAETVVSTGVVDATDARP